MPIDHTYQRYVLFPLRRRHLKTGKGRRIIKTISRHYTGLQLTQGMNAKYTTLLLQWQCCHGMQVCALESSSNLK